MTRADSGADWGRSRVTPDELADRITEVMQLDPRTKGDTKHHPTAQQAAVITADRRPALVVAGAGSGKTETMADRVVWLLANGHVRPDQILGLTFTRKAAGELAERVNTRLAQLERAGVLPAEHDELLRPEISTYNSFANTLFHEHAALIGRDADSVVLSEASAWQLARRVALTAPAGGESGDELLGLDASLDQVTQAILDLAHALSENVVDPAEVKAFAAEFAALKNLPIGSARGEYLDVLGKIERIETLPLVLELAERYTREKVQRGFVEYADQVTLALDMVRRHPHVGEGYRSRFSVVLLDEYQDTSSVQTMLLAEIFADTAVMAVGDPHQSIYGWRGASAANLAQFGAQFARESVHNEFALTISWRNGTRILDAANTLVEPFSGDSAVTVATLDPGPRATTHEVDSHVAETIADEARFAAEWLRDRLAESPAGKPATAAILFRAHASKRVFATALRDAGVPHHVVGIEGLLAEPEIADLVSALTVIDDPTAGSELVRLLAGSRWRLGVSDLQALSGAASALARRGPDGKELAPEVAALLRSSVAAGEGGSTIEALDYVAHAKDGNHLLQGFSEEGLRRLRDAGALFARLRMRRSLGLLDFVALVEQELRLDIEVIANDTMPAGAVAMEAFTEAMHDYLAVSDRGDLAGFLAWLRDVERREQRSPRQEEPERGVVQLLTVHGAKGLEWDHVVVPRLMADSFPGSPREGYSGWLRLGALPYELRQDRSALPALNWRGVESRKELKDELARFAGAVKAHHENEERRLAYVAVTRARHRLLLTGAFWAAGKKPKELGAFLLELADAGIVGELRAASRYDENPNGDGGPTFPWPADPLGGRRERVEAAAASVRQARAANPERDSTEKATAKTGSAGPWQDELDLLLEERRRLSEAAGSVELPQRFSASRFKDFVHDPDAAATALRRPMPERPYRASRLGTVFHEWVEQRYGLGGVPEALDDLGDIDSEDDGDGVDRDQLAALQAIFEQSPYAGLRPVEVEREIHLPFGGHTMVCKIDAVYEVDGRYRVVDWKTGKAPATEREIEDRQLQLALYRLAFARWKGVDPSLVDAELYYVTVDRIIAPQRIFDEDELLALWRGAVAAGPFR
ncbi:MAG: ATP-dependent helicase [Cryobacterium sp.]|nr:ATP-dependent helicase [Cryobacterium sp.]